MKRNYLVVALLAGCAIGVFRIARERAAQRHPSIATTEQFISYACDQALADADRYDHIRLDYSVSSLKQVDLILGQIHDQYAKNPASISLSGMSVEYGAYVGEVIRRNEPGAYWSRDSQAMGEKAYPIHWAAGESYTFAWCSRRITDGEGDNVWIKYSALKERSSKRHPDGSPSPSVAR